MLYKAPEIQIDPPGDARRIDHFHRDQPCRCLWRAFVQTTYTRPLRRTILQCSQIFRTLVRTFITPPSPVGVKRVSIDVSADFRKGADLDITPRRKAARVAILEHFLS
jgi:hypothetical protein